MRYKVYKEDRCPVCGRTEASERVRRNRMIRFFFRDAKLMKCRLCLRRYLVRAADQVPNPSV